MSSIPLSSILNPTLFVSRISSPTTGHELNMKMKRCHLQAAKAIFFKRNTAQSILQKGINGYIDLSPLLLSLPLLLIFHSYPSLTPTPSIPHTHSIYPSHPLHLSLYFSNLTGRIDLHGLHVAEALECLEELLPSLRTPSRNR